MVSAAVVAAGVTDAMLQAGHLRPTATAGDEVITTTAIWTDEYENNRSCYQCCTMARVLVSMLSTPAL